MQTTSGIAIYRRLLKEVRPYWLMFIGGIIGMSLSSGADAGFTWLLKPLLDKGFIERDQHFIIWLPLIIFGAFVVRGAAGYLANYNMNWISRKVIATLREKIFNHLLRLPAQYYDNTSSGQILSAITYNVEQVARASSDAILLVIREILFIAGLFVVMFSISWQMTLLFVIIAPLIAITARIAGKRMRRLSLSVQESMGHVTHIAEEVIEGYRVVRTFGGESYERDKFANSVNNNRQRELKIVATNSLSTAIVQQVAGCAIAMSIFAATAHSMQITAGGFASLLAAMLAMLKPMRNITTMSSVIQRGIAGAQSVYSLLDLPPEKDMGTQTFKRARGAIQYQEVCFRYPNIEEDVLRNINLTIAPGQMIALVGRSGGGKSTLVSLLPRFYDSYRGIITIDGIDIRNISLANLRAQCAWVSQQVTLFNDTIARNIAYGREDISRKAIEEAAIAAHADEFIHALPQGFDSLVGENGVLLSGGQRQRIAIARAILKNAPILILDEATSALDTESERHIQSALETLMHNRTTLVIAHRLSTIERADNIVVVDQGSIIEQGTHQTLLGQNGIYAKLHQMQFKEAL